ncbi:MAG: hypothetical protein K8S99_15860 [Planctomycetes bacterium]|nr:hypothetical protein [Planctomycetota bacterium]
MSRISRRTVIRAGAAGLATLTAGGWLLKSGAEPTPPSGEAGRYGDYMKSRGELIDNTAHVGRVPDPAKWIATEDNILGPYYRPGSPFRAKITPPLEPGTTLLVSGRVYAIDTRTPLSGATIDIWQADAKGHYDNDAEAAPAVGFFRCRGRLVTDESGYYEYETIHPARYMIGDNMWRPAHIHYMVRSRGYKTLVTQLYFKGDPENANDSFIKQSLIIELGTAKAPGGAYETGKFDVILEPA